MEILLFLLLGVGTGIFGSLVGIGGGLICVPVFIFFMSAGGIFPYFHTAAEITGTSLVVVLANAVSGTLAFMRQKRVFFPAAVPFALATLPGAFLGSYIVDKFSGTMLNFYFGIFLMCMAVVMYWNNLQTKRRDVTSIPAGFKFNKPLGVTASTGVGFLSSVFGVGGGVIHVPLMIYLLNFPVHIATATSTFILAVSSLVGVISHFFLGHIVWLPAICISIGAAVGAQIGARISKRTKSKVILTILSVAMLIMGIRLVVTGSP